MAALEGMQAARIIEEHEYRGHHGNELYYKCALLFLLRRRRAAPRRAALPSPALPTPRCPWPSVDSHFAPQIDTGLALRGRFGRANAPPAPARARAAATGGACGGAGSGQRAAAAAH